MLTFHILTLFPEAIKPYLDASLLGKARKKKLIKVNLVNFRKFAAGKHKSVDDKPYGGGPGMVLKIEPIYKAVSNIKSKISARSRSAFGKKSQKSKRIRTILFSTRGKLFNQELARRLSRYDHLILICGRYEGVDERVAKYVADEEISLGNFVLSGGELPALTVVEAVSRHVKGVLGKEESLEEKKGSYPVYTRPPIFSPKKGENWRVPPVLLSGNHREIEEWRKELGQSRF
jgi:tRNA (guanine37-N1)-methyltransferase